METTRGGGLTGGPPIKETPRVFPAAKLGFGGAGKLRPLSSLNSRAHQGGLVSLWGEQKEAPQEKSRTNWPEEVDSLH